MSSAGAQTQAGDPRVGLRPGIRDAGQAALHMALVGHADRPDRFFNPADPGDFSFINSDLAFDGTRVFQGSFNGFQIWDVTNPRSPRLRAAVVCPGGQNDVSVYRNLLFVSVEETRGRADCGTQGVTDTVSAERFRGVRIYDVTDVDHPRPVGAVQTCRGSHTHTLVTNPKDSANVYVYVSGTAPSRSATELAGCAGGAPAADPSSPYFRIEVIRVPIAAPQDARIVSTPRIFADSTGNVEGLWKGGAHGDGTQTTAQTNQCHDITVYTAMGLAAGACSGNGILLDIRDPANPKRIAAVSDPNFAYWHSATFSNDASTLLFSDEWGGGVAPRCRTTDRKEWGADAIFTRSGRTLTLAGYYKLPAPQTSTENCVAHNGSLVPVPGRDIMVQSWYQGGMSVVDFTDAAHPREIAFFDRGPMDSTKVMLAGYFSSYWYNGLIYGSEMGRGLDVLELQPSDLLSQSEIDAAKLVKMDRFNPQDQQKITWPASFVVARAYVDQLVRGNGLSVARTAAVTRDLARAEGMRGQGRRTALTALATRLDREASAARDSARVRLLSASVRELARSAR